MIESLLDAASDPDKNVRNAIALALGSFAATAPGREARDRVRSALGDKRWRVRFAAARAWVHLGNEPHEPIVPLLDDEYESVRWAAASVLAQRNVSWYAGRRAVPRIREPLLKALGDPAPTVRAAAVSGLGWREDEPAFLALVSALDDPDFRVRRAASIALTDERAIPALTNALHDRDLWVRVNAARTLGRLRATAAVEPLIGQLRARHRYMRQVAVCALGDIGDQRALEPVAALLERSTNPWVRRAAADTLRRLRA